MNQIRFAMPATCFRVSSFLQLSLLFGLVICVGIGTASLAWSRDEQTVFLGKDAGVNVSGVVATYRVAGESKNDVRVHVYFRFVHDKNHTSSNMLDAGESYVSQIRVGVYNFKRSGTSTLKQLFVSATLGRVYTHIYELKGRQIRAIYTKEGGRVLVTPVRNELGGFDIIESWPKNQWNDEENLGVGHYDASTNCVRRRLRWSGVEFVAVHAGLSTIDNIAQKHQRPGTRVRQYRRRSSGTAATTWASIERNE